VTAAAVVFLAPAALGSGQRIASDRVVKGPEVVTQGPEAEVAPQARAIREKVALAASKAERCAAPVWPEPRATIASEGEYPGLTPAELRKLGASPRATDGSAMSAPKGAPVSTIEAGSRPPGEEGLTLEERAKAESAEGLNR